MKKSFTYYLLILLLSTFAFKSYATHIVGGELYYDYLGANQYKITLKLFRDCFNGQPNFSGLGDDEALLEVRGYNNELVYQIVLGVPVVTYVPGNTNNPCMANPTGICVQQGVYTKIITLPPRPKGYFLSYETCCRNNTILNLVAPASQGSKYKAYVPGPELALQNSSPRFAQYPSLYVCQGQPINFNHTAIDPDGDSLVYSLCSAYNGFSDDSLVPYKSPYNGNVPLSANPPLNIHPTTGLLNGTPNMIGQWVICVRVREYRNGKLLDTHYRDFQYNVISCVLTVNSGIVDQVKKCNGATITFTNQSYSNFGMSYLWNFGVLNSSSDTSTLKDPTYTFADTGKYVVTLVVNPGLPCADSIKKTFHIYPKFDVQFVNPISPLCLKNNQQNFSTLGAFDQTAVFTSYFGAASSPSVSNASNTTVLYSAPGMKYIKRYGQQYICKDSLIDSIFIIDRPIAKINNTALTMCDPTKIEFSNGSYSEYGCAYDWTISNGKHYYGLEPSHVFTPAGNYSVTLTLTRGGVCPDTIVSPAYNLTVFPSPRADFELTPATTSIFEPEITVISRASSDVLDLQYDFNDGFTSNYMNERHSYIKPGNYMLSQTVSNKFNCSDVMTKEVIIYPEFRFWVPNVFTPGEDGLNDVFKPITIGVSNYRIDIFDRLGEKLFTSEDLDKGWNGTFKGKSCKQDVYVWKATYTNEVSGKVEMQTGHVTLLNQEY